MGKIDNSKTKFLYKNEYYIFVLKHKSKIAIIKKRTIVVPMIYIKLKEFGLHGSLKLKFVQKEKHLSV